MISRIRPEGFWVPGSVLLPEEMEAMDARGPAQIDALLGGTYAPAAAIIIGGAGIEVTGDAELAQIVTATLKTGGVLAIVSGSQGEVRSGGLFIIKSGGIHRVDAGGEIRVESSAFIQVKAGGALDMKGGLTVYPTGGISVQAGGSINVDVGADIGIAGDLTFGGANNFPKLGTPFPWERRSYKIGAADLLDSFAAAGDPLAPCAANVISRLSTGNAIESVNLHNVTKYFTILFDNLPEGGELDHFEVATKGITGTTGMTQATYQVFRQYKTDLPEAMSALITDAHDDSDFMVDLLTTTIPVTAHATIDNKYTYYVRVRCPYYSGSASGQCGYYDFRAYGESPVIMPN